MMAHTGQFTGEKSFDPYEAVLGKETEAWRCPVTHPSS